MGLNRRDYANHSARIRKSKRWDAVRLEAKRRDNFCCVECGERGRLEVDHIKPVRDAPELSYALDNLQTLCVACHSRKTRLEIGLGEINPAREAWKQLVKEMQCSNP
jgi:5-methylcytosine-specific restriction protein A